jgi:exodeoxyribonuclease X
LEDVIQRFVGAGAYVAHNCSFEKSFLDGYTGQAIWVCTYKCSLRVWPELASYSSQALRYQLGLIDPLGIDRATLVAHRALSDAIVTAAILVELLKHAGWNKLLQWSEEPALLTILGFGKTEANALMRSLGITCVGLRKRPTVCAMTSGLQHAIG